MALDELKRTIKLLRKKIGADHKGHRKNYDYHNTFSHIDSLLSSDLYTDLEKAFFLILHQYPGDHKNYIVQPRLKVLLPNVYDSNVPGIEYELDFALFGGSIDNPVKVALECDGIRSHGHKQKAKDRRKDVNLQAAGWITMRFTSKEIHEELARVANEEYYISGFLQGIENTIETRLKLVTFHTFLEPTYRDKLTGYKWGQSTCHHCNKEQKVPLNHKKITCQFCKMKFERLISPDEKILYEVNGLLYFKEK